MTVPAVDGSLQRPPEARARVAQPQAAPAWSSPFAAANLREAGQDEADEDDDEPLVEEVRRIEVRGLLLRVTARLTFGARVRSGVEHDGPSPCVGFSRPHRISRLRKPGVTFARGVLSASCGTSDPVCDCARLVAQARPSRTLSLLASSDLDPLEKSILQAALTQHQVRRGLLSRPNSDWVPTDPCDLRSHHGMALDVVSCRALQQSSLRLT